VPVTLEVDYERQMQHHYLFAGPYVDDRHGRLTKSSNQPWILILDKRNN